MSSGMDITTLHRHMPTLCLNSTVIANSVKFTMMKYLSSAYSNLSRISSNIMTTVDDLTLNTFSTSLKILKSVGKLSWFVLKTTVQHKKTTIVAVAAIVAIKILWRPLKDFFLDFISCEYGKQLNTQRSDIRQEFRDLDIPKVKVPQNVLHSSQRKNRSSAIHFAQVLSSRLGMKLHHVQPRPNQTKDSYQMKHHWLSDTDVTAQSQEPDEDHIITRFDSDYYEDINAEIAASYNTMLIYHHSPLEAAAQKSLDKPAHTFVNNKMIVEDNGAVYYKHPVWDYGVEEISYFKMDLNGFYYKAFQVETRRISDTHALTLIIPRVRYYGLSALAARARFGTNKLRHMRVKNGEFNVMRVIDEAGDHISIAKQGCYNCAKIETAALEQMQWLHENAKMPITLPRIKTQTGLDGKQAALVHEYVIKTIRRDTAWYQKNYRVEYGSNTYQMYPNQALNTPRPSMESFMWPIVNGAYCPSRDTMTETASIEGRLTKLQQHKTLSPAHIRYMEAFIKRLIPDDVAHTYHPCSVDHVFEKQSRPSQRSILEEAIYEGPGRPFSKTFVKKESYGGIKDPRIISTERPYDKLTWSMYQYTVADFLKKQPWYMFGKTPREIADKIVEIAAQSQTINCTDFSRMDGRKTVITRTLDLIFMLRLFNKEHHRDIRRLIRRKVNNRSVTAGYDDDEFHFKSLLAQLSGLPDTSNFNTLDNAFNNFVGFCNILSPSPTEEEFDKAYACVEELLAVAGDDTVVGDMPDHAICKAAKWIGHVIESDVYERGQSGVNFLARIYGPDLWTGSPNSCTDIMRALSKLHTTVAMDARFTPLDKLSQKLTSLWYTDENTPIIEHLLIAFKNAGGTLASREEHVLATYWSRYDKKDQYPNEREEYMWDLLPDENNYNEFVVHLAKVEDGEYPIEAMLYLPLLVDLEPKPHKQQTVLDKDGDQQLVGEDDTRVDLPEKQEITIPSIPHMMTCPLSHLLVARKQLKRTTRKKFMSAKHIAKLPKETQETRWKVRKNMTGQYTYKSRNSHNLLVQGPKRKGKEKKQLVHSGMAALDIVFSHMGMGFVRAKPKGPHDQPVGRAVMADKP